MPLLVSGILGRSCAIRVRDSLPLEAILEAIIAAPDGRIAHAFANQSVQTVWNELTSDACKVLVVPSVLLLRGSHTVDEW